MDQGEGASGHRVEVGAGFNSIHGRLNRSTEKTCRDGQLGHPQCGQSRNEGCGLLAMQLGDARAAGVWQRCSTQRRGRAMSASCGQLKRLSHVHVDAVARLIAAGERLGESGVCGRKSVFDDGGEDRCTRIKILIDAWA